MAKPNESAGTRGLALGLLVVALLASAMLVVEHFGGGLPGCGPRSACGDLAATAWGRIPGVGWPVAFLGLAWFAGLLAAMLRGRGPIPAPFRMLALLGALFSLLYVGVMVSLGKLCPYCLAAHLANLGFVATLLLGRTAKPTRMRPAAAGPWLATGGVVFAVVMGALVLAGAGQHQKRMDQAENERSQSVNEMVERSRSQPTYADLWGETGFTGRYLHGPEKAAIRVVMFTDYQCPDCNRIESEMEPILEARKDLSLSVMHFPFCRTAEGGKVCNKYAPRDIHPNACRAARAAEAAGIVGGNDAFWKMHFWLFSRHGEFTQAELDQEVGFLGLDREDFLAALQSDRTLEIVQSDVERAYAMGLHYTPMIFINGVELKGWNAKDALARTIAQLAATNPEPRTAKDDHPIMAVEKYVQDWQEQRVVRLPADAHPLAYGPTAGANVTVVVWGDYQESNSVDLDREARAAVAANPGVRYVFRTSVNQDCNSTLPERLPRSRCTSRPAGRPSWSRRRGIGSGQVSRGPRVGRRSRG
ncbi:MAG: thioredoxin domain-containing protein [Candidatus Eisenbacteria bacterium]